MLSSEDRVGVGAGHHARRRVRLRPEEGLRAHPAGGRRPGAPPHCRVMRENRRLNDRICCSINEALERRVEEQTALLRGEDAPGGGAGDRGGRGPAEEGAGDRPAHPDLDPAQAASRCPGWRCRRTCCRRRWWAATTTTCGRCPTAAGSASATCPGHGLTAGLLMMMIQSGISALTLAPPGRPAPRGAAPPEPHVVGEHPRAPGPRRLRHPVPAALLPRRPPAARRRPRGHPGLPGRAAAPASASPPPAPGWAACATSPGSPRPTPSRSRAGDTVVLFTDGITEARASDRSFYGLDRLCALLEEHRGLPVPQLHERLLADVQAFTPTPDDDMTLLVMRHQPHPQLRGLILRWPSSPPHAVRLRWREQRPLTTCPSPSPTARAPARPERWVSISASIPIPASCPSCDGSWRPPSIACCAIPRRCSASR